MYLGLIPVVPHKAVAVGCCESTHLLIYLCIDLASWLSISLSNSVSIYQPILPTLSISVSVRISRDLIAASKNVLCATTACTARGIKASHFVSSSLPSIHLTSRSVDWSLEHLSQELFKESCLFLWSCWSKWSFCSKTKRMKRKALRGHHSQLHR